MFDGLKPEVEALLNTAASDLPTAEADAGLLAAMSDAVSATPLFAPAPARRSPSLLKKVITAKAAVFGGVLVLSAGVASATGHLPDPAQDAASSVANVVGLDIPKSDKKEHPENHGKDVSGVARDKSTTTDGVNHGSVVCEVASEGKCKPNADEEPGQGDSADKRQDGSHRNENSVKTTTTSTTTDGAGPTSDEGKTRGKSGEHKP